MKTKVGIIVTCACLLAGCGLGQHDTGGPSGEGTVVKPKSAPSAADPGVPIAKATFGARGGNVEVGLLSLTARGKLAHLAMTLTPDATVTGTVGVLLFGRPDMYPSLIDPVNLKRYKVVRDSGGVVLGDGNPSIRPGAATTINFTFAAPPENVQTVDVQYGDFPPFRNVQITR
jgi:hypothetical protein